MPYIKQTDRDEIDPRDGSRHPKTAGELNYLFTGIVQRYCYGSVGQSILNYQKINDVLGALEGAKLEFYRRVVQKYEDQKIRENGDVY